MSAAGAAAARRPRSAGRLARAALVLPVRLRRRLLLTAALVALLLCGYLFWLRDSALVRVEMVTVTGLTSSDSGRIRASLTAAARQMSTLHVDRESLERATAAFPVVRSIEVRPDFPSGMRIRVVEHRPAALVLIGSRRVPVAADGSILEALRVRGELPLIRAGGTPRGGRIDRGPALSAVRVAAGLPAALATRVDEVRLDGARGVVVPIEDGPRVIFGTTARAKAKWAAAVRVLADRDAAGAAYIDVRVPERPVAGGLPVATVAPAPPAGRAAPAQPVAPPPPPANGPPPGAGAAAPQAPPPPAGGPTAPPQAGVGAGGGATANPQP